MGWTSAPSATPTPPPPAPRRLLLLDRVNGIYKKLVTDGEGAIAAGAILVGTAPITSGCCSTTKNGVARRTAAALRLVGRQGPHRAPGAAGYRHHLLLPQRHKGIW